MQSKYDYIKQITEIHGETIRRLLDQQAVNLPELAELFEDIGNVYLDLSEEIRRDVIFEQTLKDAKLGHLISAPSFLTEKHEEACEDLIPWQTRDCPG